ncbi:hypothetical protein PGT21_015397 [Puccinia graminis f. sp. tritici]|uniref:Uncharacterized protein n=1 Tax=Puccinia graminis f. sp. tritici TaxID=56615 RepID=A0A5B0M8P2_PUCGR|nr:hypothetical protein PGT21_015397 [Puccinia graminis f. sp. tritici]
MQGKEMEPASNTHGAISNLYETLGGLITNPVEYYFPHGSNSEGWNHIPEHVMKEYTKKDVIDQDQHLVNTSNSQKRKFFNPLTTGFSLQPPPPQKKHRFDQEGESNEHSGPAVNLSNFDFSKQGFAQWQTKFDSSPKVEYSDGCKNRINQREETEKINFLLSYSNHPSVGFTSGESTQNQIFVDNLERYPQSTLPRLSFTSDVFCEDLRTEKRLDVVEILELISSLGSSTLVIPKDNLHKNLQMMNRLSLKNKSRKVILPKSSHRNLHFSQQKHSQFFRFQNTWYTYWKEQTHIDFKSYYLENLKIGATQNIFPIYLFYVDLILTIIPQDEARSFEKSRLVYAEELAKAGKLFADLEEYETKSINGIEADAWEETRKAVSYAIQNGESYISRAVWVYLELWVRIYYKDLWANYKEKDGKHLSRFVKGAITKFFSYSIEKISKKYADLLHKAHSS